MTASALDRFLFGRVAAVRPYLAQKALLALIGFDCILDLAAHGGRYGIGGFNVAHFAVLDAALPTPTPALYVGALFTISALAFVLVLGRVRRALLVALTILYTLAWAASLLDAYQHHYLISLLLVSMCAFPVRSIRDFEEPLEAGVAEAIPDEPTVLTQTKLASKSKAAKQRRALPASGDPDSAATRPRDARRVPKLAPAPGYVSFLVTAAIVYGFTAVTKLDPDWRSGAALRRIVDPATLDALWLPLTGLGFTEAEVYAWLARGAIATQIVCAAALVLATLADRARPRVRLAITTLMLAPLAFHAAADAMELEIGWFSRYMVVIALVALAPHELLRALVRLASRVPARAAPPENPFTLGVFMVLGALVACVALATVDLPGTLGAGIAASAIVALVFGHELRRGELVRARELPIALATAGLLAWACVARPAIGYPTDDGFVGLEAPAVRYDYYRFVGGDLRRRREFTGALAAYRKAHAYAPDETLQESVAATIARLRTPE